MPGTIEKRGKNSYRISISDGRNPDGSKRRLQQTLKFPEGMTEKARQRACEEQMALLYAQLQTGGTVCAKQITLEEIAVDYLENHSRARGLSATTVAGYRILLERINPVLGGLPVQKITPQHITRFYTSLYETDAKGNHKAGKKLSGNTVHHYHTLLRALLNYAVKMGYIVANPALRVTPPRQEERDATVYDDEQSVALLEALETAPLKYRAGVMLGLLGQMRKGEIAGLNWEDVDFDGCVLHIRRSANVVPGQGVQVKEPKTKAGKRMIALPADLVAILKRLKAEQAQERLQLGETWKGSPAVFVTWDGSRQYPDTIGNWFAKFLVENGLPHIRFHDLRHTGASLLFAQGVDVQTISARLGHSKTSVTMDIYGHAYNKFDRSAVDNLDALLTRKLAQK